MSTDEIPIPLAGPDIGDREVELVTEALRSGRLSLGPMIDRFEREFAGWMGAPDAVAVSSGTAALHLAVRGLGWGAGDEVLTTPFSFVASSNCLLFEGAKPVFCDIDPVTLNIDPTQVDAAVGPATAGILPVHIFGYPAALPELGATAERAGVPILEDACQAVGAVDAEGVRIGARGNDSTFAFYANKVMTTGEGGAYCTTDPARAEVARSERNQGRSADMSVVDHVRIGFNYRMTDLQAAIGVAQVEKLDRMLATRAELARGYGEELTAIGGAPAGEGDPDGLVLPCADRGSERRSWFVYPIRVPKRVERDEFLRALNDRGVSAKAYLPTIHTMPPYRERFGFSGGEFPVAEEVALRSVALPFFGAMTPGQVGRVVAVIREALT